MMLNKDKLQRIKENTLDILQELVCYTPLIGDVLIHHTQMKARKRGEHLTEQVHCLSAPNKHIVGTYIAKYVVLLILASPYMAGCVYRNHEETLKKKEIALEQRLEQGYVLKKDIGKAFQKDLDGKPGDETYITIEDKIYSVKKINREHSIVPFK